MTGRAIARQLQKALGPDASRFRLKGSLAYLLPNEHLLRALKVETSSFSAVRINVECFVMPLFPPRDYLAFTIGGRLGRITGGPDKWWTVNPGDEASVFEEIADLIRKEALPFFARFGTPETFALGVERGAVATDPRWGPEAAAYAWILAGQPERGLAMIRRLATDIEVSRQGPWEILVRLREIERLTLEDLSRARARLDEWSAATKLALKLDA